MKIPLSSDVIPPSTTHIFGDRTAFAFPSLCPFVAYTKPRLILLSVSSFPVSCMEEN